MDSDNKRPELSGKEKDQSIGAILKRDGIREEFLKEELPENAVLSFDNDGNIVVKNRAYRRQKLSLVQGNAATVHKKTPNERRKARKAERQNKKKGR